MWKEAGDLSRVTVFVLRHREEGRNALEYLIFEQRLEFKFYRIRSVSISYLAAMFFAVCRDRRNVLPSSSGEKCFGKRS
jgi:hypothetical protein